MKVKGNKLIRISLSACLLLVFAGAVLACQALQDGGGTPEVGDEVQIQATIDALPPEGGTVTLEARTYLLAWGIYINRDNVRFIGQGSKTVLRLKDGANLVGGVINITECAQVEVSDLEIDGNKENNALTTESRVIGVYMTRVRNVTLRRLDIQGANWDGVNASGSDDVLIEDVHASRNGVAEGEANFDISSEGTTPSKRVTFVRCISENSARDGFELEDGVEDVLLKDCQSISDVSAGFNMHNHEGKPANKRVTFENCSSVNSGSGFALYGLPDAYTEDVKLLDCASTDSEGGILLSNVSGASIERNNIRVQANAGASGIRAIESREITMTNNVLDVSAGNDAAINGGTTITGNKATGVVVRIAPDSNAKVSGNEGWISLDGVANVEVTGNRGFITLNNGATDCTVAGNYSAGSITIDSSSRIVIRGNILGGANSNGISERGNSDYNTITGNDVRTASNVPKIIIIGAHTKVEGNRGVLSKNSGTAIIPAGATDVTVIHELDGYPNTLNVTSAPSVTFTITGKSNVQFIITIPLLATQDIQFSWSAEK